ncbi:MAG TPA: hypothetical protein VEX43_07130 [Chthoniobacterales bacterium]|nr:hypothetical protein [Chthoniobacterales bacterium]
MDLYIFGSSTVTNIWAGVGARKWAISRDQAQMPGAKTKARALPVGAVGLLYCSQTHTFSTPFLCASTPEVEESVTGIWPEEWFFPFDILPLGSPLKQMTTDDVSALPTIKASGKPWNRTLRVQGQFVFQSTTITTQDRAILFDSLRW